jgi:hypothetical protein
MPLKISRLIYKFTLHNPNLALDFAIKLRGFSLRTTYLLLNSKSMDQLVFREKKREIVTS